MAPGRPGDGGRDAVNTQARAAPAGELQRLRIEVRGLVQGVGFRPQVLRVAGSLGLAGWVRNHGAGVSIEVEGPAAEDFPAALQARLPLLARIDGINLQRMAPDRKSTRLNSSHYS